MRRLLASFVFASIASGCFVVNDPTQHWIEPVESDSFCEAWAEIYCEGALPCTGFSVPPEECLPQLEASCRGTFGPLLGDSRTGYDAFEAGEQLATGLALAEACGSDFHRWQASGSGLGGVFAGSVVLGGSCNPTLDEPTQGLDIGRFYSCEQETTCRAQADGEWRCVPRPGLGESCLPGINECAEGRRCGAGDVCATDLIEDYGPCDESSDCRSAACQVAFQFSDEAVPGHCMPLELGYRSLFYQCEPARIGYERQELGPVALVEGTDEAPRSCPHVGYCVVDENQRDRVNELAADAGVTTVCSEARPDAPPICPIYCEFEVGTLDAPAVELVCALTRLQRPVAPVCRDAPLLPPV